MARVNAVEPSAGLRQLALATHPELTGRVHDGFRGKFLVSVPVDRGDVGPDSDRDSLGRLMIIRTVEQVKLLFERLGFELQNEWKTADSAGRDILWVTLFFRSSGASTRAIDRVESTVNADRKVATYKLALIRALCDIAMTTKTPQRLATRDHRCRSGIAAS